MEAELRKFLADWTGRDNRIATASYFGNFAVYFASFFLALWSLPHLWLTIPLIVINAFSGVRLYVLQHDCGHNTLFEKRWQNEWAGYGLSTFTLTPFKAMQFNHNRHHQHLGDLDERESGEVFTMTLKEWEAAGPGKRTWYRLYRNPLLMLPLGGIFVYAFRYRWPKNTLSVGWRGVMLQNAGLALWLTAIWFIAGWPGLAVYAATVVTAGIIGVFSVYLQHNFEHTHWDRKPSLKPRVAALKGSSAVSLGHWYDIATANISYHDLHHFNANVPSYKLRKCHAAAEELFHLPVIRGWREALFCFTLKLWDEDNQVLVPFPNPVWERYEARAAA